jgi:hypothetical protein
VSEWAQQAPEIWKELRSECPVAHTERFGGCWFPARHDDVSEIAHDTEHFSSRGMIVNDMGFRGDAPVGYAPPISSDPPFHAIARKLLLGPFSPRAVAELEPATRDTCRRLAAELIATADSADGLADAATDYAQHIPVRVIAHMLGLPESDGDRFRSFIHRVLEKPGQVAVSPDDTMAAYLENIIPGRRENPGDDLISYLVQADIDGMPLTDDHVFGSIALLLIAGIDTTWSAIGSSLWHLAQHPEDRRRLGEDPDVMVFALEEFLRSYAPVTMARLVAKDHDFHGCPMKEDDWVLLPFPAANRDPRAFEDADTFIIDREENRHAAFGLGIHRCLGSNLARLELKVAIEEFVARFPDFELAGDTTWSVGQIRGPRTLPVRILQTAD